MTCWSLRPFDCTIRMIICAPVDVTIFEPDNLAGTKSTAIAEGEHHLIPEAAGHGKQPLRLVGAHREQELLRLLEV